MRSLTLGLAILLSTGTATAQVSIRLVDFANFTYPVSGHLLGHDRLEWLNIRVSAKREIHLVKGSDLAKTSSFVMGGKIYAQYEGFTLESVKFADLTGDGNNEAIVVLEYHTGGTQTTNYVYIYTLQDRKPKLLAYCHTGDRGDSGLYKVYGSGGLLVFELFDPAKQSGECCSAGLVIRRFKWRGGRFEVIGVPEHRPIQAPKSSTDG